MEHHLMLTIMVTFVYKMAKVQYVNFKGEGTLGVHPSTHVNLHLKLLLNLFLAQ